MRPKPASIPPSADAGATSHWPVGETPQHATWTHTCLLRGACRPCPAAAGPQQSTAAQEATGEQHLPPMRGLVYLEVRSLGSAPWERLHRIAPTSTTESSYHPIA